MSLITTYNPLPISFTKGEGIWLYDAQGKAYLDSFSGVAVCSLGHAHPDVTKSIQAQAAKLIHTSNIFLIDAQEKLAEKLTRLTGMEQIFFCNSGAEAIETAIKLGRLYGHHLGIDSPSLIAMEGAFHGRTMGALSASGSRRVQAGFEPLVHGFVRASYNNLDAIHTIAANRDDVVGILLEPIQGESGINVASVEYLRALDKLCEERKWLFMIDEIQTGVGRTGSLYYYLDLGLKPDVVTTAKGLGNGVPIAACMMSKKASNLFKPGNHGSTFGGNPLACSTALTVLDVIERDKLCERAAKHGALLQNKLAAALKDNPHIIEIRGKGLMLGIECDQPMADLRMIGLKNGILINITVDKVIRILPALTISEEEVSELAERLLASMTEFFAKAALKQA